MCLYLCYIECTERDSDGQEILQGNMEGQIAFMFSQKHLAWSLGCTGLLVLEQRAAREADLVAWEVLPRLMSNG